LPRIVLGLLIGVTTALVFAGCLFLIGRLDLGQWGDIIAVLAVAVCIRFLIFKVWRRFGR
jgi:hypothetical protein